MIERNPFFIKSYEGTNSDFEYLQFFNVEALKPIDREFLQSIKYINSSPGAGKTSIFKAFSPSVMRIVLENHGDSYQEMYQYMQEQKIIEDDEVKLLSCYISCARNYDAIEEEFTNGKRKQVFFALLNTKIIIACLRALCQVKKLNLDDDLQKITFENIPDEMLVLKEHFRNGQTLFEWACDTETELCRYLDDYDENPLQLSFIHTTLLCTKLFEPNCIRINGKECINKTLFIFDDFHKLTENQRSYLMEAFCVLRIKAGVWFGQRFVGLSSNQILLPDGMVGREYDENIELNLENYWSQGGQSKSYFKMLSKIANQRLSGLSDMPAVYDELVENELQYKEYTAQINQGIKNLMHLIQDETKEVVKYKNVYEHILCSYDNYEKAIRLQVLWMMIRRDQSGQLKLDLEPLERKLYEQLYKDSHRIASYYFRIDNGIPFYFGTDALYKLSSFNIEQFLSFAGSIFELNKAGKIIGGKNFIRVSAEEQQKLFKILAEKRWDDILQRFSYGEKIQNILSNLCQIAIDERNRESNSYNGGTFSGIGIDSEQLRKILAEEKYRELKEVLRQCISAWYFEKRVISQSGKEWVVLYYNRWICLKFDLPLAYGGWKPMKAEKLNSCLYDKKISLENEYEYVKMLWSGD